MIGKTLERLRSANSDIGKGFERPKIGTGEAEAIYYSSWIYAAVHVALAVPRLQSIENLSRRLGLGLGTVEVALMKLEELGLAERVGASKTWGPIAQN